MDDILVLNLEDGIPSSQNREGSAHARLPRRPFKQHGARKAHKGNISSHGHGSKISKKSNWATQHALHGNDKPTADTGDAQDMSMRGTNTDEDEDITAAVALALQRDKDIEAVVKDSGGASASQATTAQHGAHSLDLLQHDGRPPKRRKLTGDATGHPEQLQPNQHRASVVASPHPVHSSRPHSLAVEVFPAAMEVQDAGAHRSWSDLGLDSSLVKQLASLQFDQPTPVQQSAIPVLLSGRDTLVRSPTGSGKTLSYLLPMIHDLQAQQPRISRGEGTYAVVVAPTRELCLQINEVAVQLMRRYWWLVAGVLIGGESRGHEKARLRKGVTLVAATPGRLLDHLQNTAAFRTGELRWLVLDEADRLLDLGFKEKLQLIIGALDKRSEEAGGSAEGGKRRTALLSATLHGQLTELAAVSLQHPVAIGFTPDQVNAGFSPVLEAGPAQHSSQRTEHSTFGTEQYTIPAQLRQSFIEVPSKQRLVSLAGLLCQKMRPHVKQPRKLVVFMACCDSVQFFHKLLGDFWSVACHSPLLTVPLLKLHGDMPQVERTANVQRFTLAQSAVLICTDVAARGLDFPDITTIIQYDVPGAPTEYVHRVGRTARMGHGGEAVLFLLPTEHKYVELLASKGVQLQEDMLADVLSCLPAPGGVAPSVLGGIGKAAMHISGKNRDPDKNAFAVQRLILQAISNNEDMRELASNAFRAFVRSYATHHASLKQIFHVKLLHLGHVAFSFGLKDTPTFLGHSESVKERKRKKREMDTTKQKLAKKQLFKQAALMNR